MGMDMMGGMGEEKLNPLMQFYMSLPEWGQALARTLIVILAAALIGMVLGRLYASVRYPDPEKSSAISPKLRVLFLAVLLVCGFWLYRSMTKKDEPVEPVDGTGISEDVRRASLLIFWVIWLQREEPPALLVGIKKISLKISSEAS